MSKFHILAAVLILVSSPLLLSSFNGEPAPKWAVALILLGLVLAVVSLYWGSLLKRIRGKD
ncbi:MULTISPECIES: hypothetical protein [Pseudomonas]|jgi:hypothetical protein|uniref:Dmt superfamily drug metabolite transporter n=2 Tax=Pseudomonas TaxID=286 RepID=A0A1L7NN71_PSEPU|nr:MULTISPECIES: hypothetical protein [Pseudomonas]KAB0494900.1 hypothetical protein F7R06_29410 [Pseudomonas moorei]MDD2039581.1 hypothetical protein [Pseudomonas putida]MDD2082380.1 hypothetical protein [Pseudomonas putida]QDW60919.1 hypothetical protein FFH79_029315 [Pseudomonas sp. KBS0802]QLJ17365.1 hypothetical protein H0H12_29025 [Pseudomonas putida]